MKSKHIIIAFISVGICTSFVYMFNDGDSVKAYNSEVSKERKDKDEFMQNANESPFQSNK